MRRWIIWARSNPITTASALVLPICLAVLILIHTSGSSFVEQMKEREKPIQQIKELLESSVEVPSANPDEPMQQMKFTITDAAIRELERIRDHMNREYQSIFRWAVSRNLKSASNHPHQPMVEGLFPGPPTDPAAPRVARDEYLNVLKQWTGPADPQAPQPRLNAGRPLSYDELEREMAEFEANYRQSNLMADEAEELSEADFRELRDKKYEKLINRLREHAQRIHIYANTPVEGPSGTGQFVLATDTPFYVGPWARPDRGDMPSLLELWQAQLDLWFQKDIVEAIAMTNGVGDEQMNVMQAPIKRLIHIEMEPGFVGVNSEGAVAGFETRAGDDQVTMAGASTVPRMGQGAMDPRMMRMDSRRHGMGGAMGGFGPRGMGGIGGMGAPGIGAPGRGAPGMYGDPAMRHAQSTGYSSGTEDEYGEEGDGLDRPEGMMPEDFQASPSGRRSNALYDVRHARVKVLIDSTRIPQFINNLATVNFMTVLMASVRDVDEYQHLRGLDGSGAQGGTRSTRSMYIYGPHDVVELELVVESLWLRRWTAGHWDEDEARKLGEQFDPGLMPDEVRGILRLPLRASTDQNNERRDDDES